MDGERSIKENKKFCGGTDRICDLRMRKEEEKRVDD